MSQLPGQCWDCYQLILNLGFHLRPATEVAKSKVHLWRSGDLGQSGKLEGNNAEHA